MKHDNAHLTQLASAKLAVADVSKQWQTLASFHVCDANYTYFDFNVIHVNSEELEATKCICVGFPA